MYFEKMDTQATIGKIQLQNSSMIAISLNGIAVLVLGIFPGALFSLCHFAFTV